MPSFVRKFTEFLVHSAKNVVIEPLNQKNLLLLLLGAGLLIRLVILLLPFEVLFSRWGSDDLFYYTQIAGHFWETGMLSFDGASATNGFQPLFLFLLLPFGHILLDDVQLSVYLTFALATALTLFAGWQIPRLMRDWQLPPQLGLIATGVFFLHPKVISTTFNGTEAALSFLMVILALRAFAWLKHERNPGLTSLILGGLVLTRLDFSVLLLLLFVFGMVRGDRFGAWVNVLILPTLLVLGWLTLNILFFGSLVPSSGAAKTHYASIHDINYLKTWLGTFKGALLAESKISFSIILLCALGILLAVRERSIPYLNYASLLFLLSALCGLVPVLFLGSFRDWYLIPQYVFIFFLTSLGVYQLLRLRRFQAVVILVLTVGIWLEAQWAPRSFNGNLYLKACTAFEKHLPMDAKIGAFNSGLVGCALESHTVVNLDGVVNNAVLPYYPEKNLGDYLEKENIYYLLDNKASIDYFLQEFSKPLDVRELSSVKELDHEVVLIILGKAQRAPTKP